MCPLHSAVTCGLSRRVESVQLVAVQQEVGWADGEKIVRKHLEALLSVQPLACYKGAGI